MTGSSLTFNHYLGSHYGEVYGLEGAPERFQVKDWLRPRTDIKGLYMTGQDVTTLGVTGALMSGILTAHSCLGYGGVSDLISGRNLIEDIWHLDPSLKDKQKKEKDGAGPAIG
jgi:all-trans-retinol 13,14-reductase